MVLRLIFSVSVFTTAECHYVVGGCGFRSVVVVGFALTTYGSKPGYGNVCGSSNILQKMNVIGCLNILGACL
jgi:hypothetical protein